MFQAVLLYLKHVIKGAIQLLHRHLNGTLHTSEDSSHDPDQVQWCWVVL